MKVSIIAAVAENGVIGKDNQLIWKLSDDLKNFKRITKGHYVIMGRKTYESIGKPLPDRTNIILSENNNYKADNCLVFNSLDHALAYSIRYCQKEVFVIGGEHVFRDALQIASKIYLTKVKTTPEGDAFFPKIDYSRWIQKFRAEIKKNDRNDYDFEFIELLRRSHKEP